MKFSDFEICVPLFEGLGLKIKTWRDKDKHKNINSIKSFKLEADKKAHEILSNHLSEYFPGIKIISEEDKIHSIERPEKYWLIDPIDGTSSWYHGFNGYVTQAAYIENNIPIYGIIHAPELKKTWIGLKDSGSKLNGVFLKKLNESKKIIMIDNTPNPHGITKKIMNEINADSYLECGSLGLKTVLIADGTADLFVKDVIVRDWDLVPAYVILNEVGGFLAKINGDNFTFDGSFEKRNGFVVARDEYLLNKCVRTIQKINN